MFVGMSITSMVMLLVGVTVPALGVAVVVWIASCYESARQWVTELVFGWVGRTHVYVRSPLGKWGELSENCAEVIRTRCPEVKDLTVVLRRQIKGIKAVEQPDSDAARHLDPVKIEATGVDTANELKFRSPKMATGRPSMR